MTEVGTVAFAWFATAWLHGLALFVLAFGAEKSGLAKAAGLRQALWRAVLLAPLLTAAAQLFAMGGSPTFSADLTATAPAPAVEAAARAEAVAVALPTEPPVTVRAVGLDAGVLLSTAPAVLGWAWLAWAAVALLRLGAQRARLWAYRRRLAPVDDAERLADAEALRRRAGLTRLTLYEDPALDSPIALASGAVVLPAWMRERLNAEQRRALLAHEARHLARRDPQWRAALGVAVLASLAPHGRLALGRLDELAEQACDAWSARETGGGRALAQCLAACMERGLSASTPGWAAAMAQPDRPVVERVRRLLDGAAEFEPGRGPAVALAVAGLCAAALATPGFAVGAPAAAQPARPAAAVRPAATAMPATPAAAAAPEAPELPKPRRAPRARGAARAAAVAPVAPVAAMAPAADVADLADLADLAVRPRREPRPAHRALPAVAPIPAIPVAPVAPVAPVVPVAPPAPPGLEAPAPLPEIPALPPERDHRG